MNQTLDCAIDVAGVSDILETLCRRRPTAAQRWAPLHIRYASLYRRYRSCWCQTRVLAGSIVAAIFDLQASSESYTGESIAI